MQVGKVSVRCRWAVEVRWYNLTRVPEILTEEQLREGTRQLSRHKRTMVIAQVSCHYLNINTFTGESLSAKGTSSSHRRIPLEPSVLLIRNFQAWEWDRSRYNDFCWCLSWHVNISNGRKHWRFWSSESHWLCRCGKCSTNDWLRPPKYGHTLNILSWPQNYPHDCWQHCVVGWRQNVTRL